MRKILATLIGLASFVVMTMILIYFTHALPGSRGVTTPNGLFNLPFIIGFFFISKWLYNTISQNSKD